MTVPAVAEQPTDTKAVSTEEPKATETLDEPTGTDPVAAVQTDEKPAAPATISPLLAAIQSGDESDLQARIQAEARKLVQADKVEKRSTGLKADLAGKFNAAVTRLVGQLGEEATQPVWDALNALHLDVATAAVAPVREEYEEWLEDFIPEADREAYHKETAGQSTEAKFKAAAEYLVTGTKAIKAMSLEDFVKHSTKGRSDLKAALAAADQGGYDRGTEVPGGDPTGSTEKRAASSNSTYTDEASMRAAHAKGEITNAQARDWLNGRRS